MNAETLTATLVVAGFVYVFTNLLKSLRARDWNNVVTIVLAWLVAFGALWLTAQTTFGQDTPFVGVFLRSVSVADLLVYAMFVSGVGGVVFDFIKSRAGVPPTGANDARYNFVAPRPTDKPPTT